MAREIVCDLVQYSIAHLSFFHIASIDLAGTEYAQREGLWNATDRALDADDGMDSFALIDIDGFLVPRGGYASVHVVVDNYLALYHGGLMTVNWMLFCSSKKMVYAPIPVTK